MTDHGRFPASTLDACVDPAPGVGSVPVGCATSPAPDPSARLVEAFSAVAVRMAGLPFVNPTLAVEAVEFAPWQGHWLGVLLTPWFMNLVLTPRDRSLWRPVRQGRTRSYMFPAGAYEFIGAHDDIAGEYQLCSLFSPVLAFEDQETARLVARLARKALFDGDNAEKPDMPLGNLSPHPDPRNAPPGPLERLETRRDAPQSKRDFLRGRFPGDDHDHRR
jgi:[NiFe] hydrogenase assembly HybE family chaperone